MLLDDARSENVMQPPGVSSCGAWFLERQAALNLNHVRPKPTGPPWRCTSSESQDRVGPPWGLFHGFLNNTKRYSVQNIRIPQRGQKPTISLGCRDGTGFHFEPTRSPFPSSRQRQPPRSFGFSLTESNEFKLPARAWIRKVLTLVSLSSPTHRAVTTGNYARAAPPIRTRGLQNKATGC